MQNVLHTRYYNINKKEQGKYIVQTRSQAKTSGAILPKVHGIDKEIDLDIIPEKPVIRPVVTPSNTCSTCNKNISQVKPRIDQVK